MNRANIFFHHLYGDSIYITKIKMNIQDLKELRNAEEQLMSINNNNNSIITDEELEEVADKYRTIIHNLTTKGK